MHSICIQYARVKYSGPAISSPNIDYGRRVRQLRKSRHISQLALEEMAGMSTGTISRIEHNIVSPTKETLTKISRTLRLTKDEVIYLFGVEEIASQCQ